MSLKQSLIDLSNSLGNDVIEFNNYYINLIPDQPFESLVNYFEENGFTVTLRCKAIPKEKKFLSRIYSCPVTINLSTEAIRDVLNDFSKTGNVFAKYCMSYTLDVDHFWEKMTNDAKKIWDKQVVLCLSTNLEYARLGATRKESDFENLLGWTFLNTISLFCSLVLILVGIIYWGGNYSSKKGIQDLSSLVLASFCIGCLFLVCGMISTIGKCIFDRRYGNFVPRFADFEDVTDHVTVSLFEQVVL